MASNIVQTKHAPVTIDGKEYKYEDLSDKAKSHLASIVFVDGEIQRFQNIISVYQTARASYFQVVKEEIKSIA